MVLSAEGGLEALPMIEPFGSDVEMSVDFPFNVVSWLIGVSSCWLPAGLLRFHFPVPRLRLMLPRSVFVVLPSLPGYFSSCCFQPRVCDWFSCVCALLATLAAATVYMNAELSKHAAAACAAAVLFPVFLEGLLGCFEDDFSCLVGKFVLMMQEFLVGGFAGLESHFVMFCVPRTAARKLLFNERSKLAAAAFEAAFLYLGILDGDFAV